MMMQASIPPPSPMASTPLTSNSTIRKKQRRFVSRKNSSQSSATTAFADTSNNNVPLTSTKPFLALLTLLALALTIQFAIVFSWHHKRHDVHVLGKLGRNNNNVVMPQLPLDENVGDLIYMQQDIINKDNNHVNENGDDISHLYPHIPPLPPINNIHRVPDPVKLVEDTLAGHKPTIAGVTLILADFLNHLHMSNKGLALKAQAKGSSVTRDEVHEAFVHLAEMHLLPLEAEYVYQKKPMFPTRKDDSIFMSLASFRDHLLGDTLKGAFDQAKHPDKLYIGAIVQNCFGLNPYPGEEGVQCRTGAQVVGKDKRGRDTTKVSDAPPDKNGIEEFCESEAHKKYCLNGQVRVLYLHENESLGPAMARYYASKLWGGETYFVQTDSHLEFYKDWDELYINELKATKAYPKSVLSAYPPGFQEENGGILEGEPSPGARLCTCEFSSSDVEAKIIRINTGVGYHGGEERPTQIPFIAAGFFFASAEFLVDVPFDPYMPWCFMGEEIMLSMRAWTNGWTVYAPRKNWIAHQYRPGRMGLPKFWGSVGRLFGRPGPGFSNQLQLKLIKRVKYLVGYKDCCTREKLIEEGSESVLQQVEHYGFGNVRSREEYLKWAKIDVDNQRCNRIEWCNQGTLE